MTAVSRPGTPAEGHPAEGPERQRDAERTRREILEVAIGEFARNGYSGARVDEIAARTSTTKRMIYYYFGGKEQLYIAALEQAYATARAAETVDVDHLDPVAAMRTMAELTFDHQESHPDFVSLVAIENIHHGEFIAKSAAIAALNSPVVAVIASILERGYAAGVFLRPAEAIDIHQMISSFCFFRMANRYTFGAIFGVDLLDASRRDHYRRMAGDMVVSYLTAPPDPR
jgi:AcrR family transcriptional regulator